MKVLSQVLSFAIFSLSLDYINGDTRYCNEGLGICTPFYECSNSTVFNNGESQIHVRFNVELETEACHYLEMCCDPEDISVIQKNEYIGPPSDQVGIDVGSHTADNYNPSTASFGGDSYVGRTEDVTDSPNVTNDPDCSTESSINPLKHEVNPGNTCNEHTHNCVPFFYCTTDTTTDGADLITSRNDIGLCSISSQVCCDNNHNILKLKPSLCGLRNKDGVGYQVTNSVDEAQYAEFPWMAALSIINYEGNFEYICGGSLIHPHVILTGAHCVYNKDVNFLRVRLGEWDTQTTKEILPHSDHEVEQVIKHSDFGPANLFNDIALLVLKTPARLSMNINTVCLPPQDYKFNSANCFASGWGSDKFGHEGIYRVNLKKIELPIVPLKNCQDSLRTTALGPRFKIHAGFMCAGGEKDVDTCTGDGGSPLVCPVDDKNDIYYQAGIVAWGIECGQQGIPGVYANVAKYRRWIDQHMNDLGYGTQSYTV